MAQIVTSEVFRNRLLADGRRRIRYRYVVEDNDLNTEEHFVGPLHRPGDWDVAGNLSVYGDSLLEGMRSGEEREACDANLEGNPLTISTSSKYSTQKRIAKKLIRWMMREKDPRIVIWLEPLLDHIEANYTPAQIRNFLDISTAQLQKMNQRIKAILDPPTVSTSVKALLVDFDAEEEEWL